MARPSKDHVYRSMKRLYGSYIRGCKRRNVFWGLTVEEFHSLTSKDCHYCGKRPAQRCNSYVYNGIDRVNHRHGYYVENAVSACGECNFIKGTSLTHDEMKVVGEALSSFRQRLR